MCPTLSNRINSLLINDKRSASTAGTPLAKAGFLKREFATPYVNRNTTRFFNKIIIPVTDLLTYIPIAL